MIKVEEKTAENFESEKISQGGAEESLDSVAVEESFDLLVNGARVASLMVSPSDLEALGYGYLVAEGIVESKDQIILVRVRENEIHAFVEGSKKIEEMFELRSSGCVGVHWDEEKRISVGSDFTVTPETVFQALRHLGSDVYDKTSGSHSASLVDEAGGLLVKTVDVGRHNTYDKIIGKALLEDIDLQRTILLSTGRQSAGMVMKAARVEIPIVVTKAAPLSSGIEAAKRANVALICFADDEKIKIFAGSERLDRSFSKSDYANSGMTRRG